MKLKQIDFGEFKSAVCEHNIAVIQCRKCLPLDEIKYDIDWKTKLFHPIQTYKLKKHFKRSLDR